MKPLIKQIMESWDAKFNHPKKEVKPNYIKDYELIRFDKLQRLRIIALEIASQTHDDTKLRQCHRLIQNVTERLNNRYTNCNRFNMN